MPRAVLIGPPGSGKSSVARALAKALSCTFIDTDSVIEEVAHKTIKAIFAQDGEPRFREIEEEVVLGVLASEPGVVALGGGSILSKEVREVLSLKRYPVIYLTVSANQAVARVSKSDARPLLSNDPQRVWLDLLNQRAHIYEELADLTISTDNRKAIEISQELCEKLDMGESS